MAHVTASLSVGLTMQVLMPERCGRFRAQDVSLKTALADFMNMTKVYSINYMDE